MEHARFMADEEVKQDARLAWLTASLVTTGYHAPKKFPESPGVLLGEKPSDEVVLASPKDFKDLIARRKRNKPKSKDRIGQT